MNTADYYLSDNLADVKVRLLDGTTLSAHCIILARLDYFKSLLVRKDPLIQVDVKVNPDAFKKALALLYGANKVFSSPMTYPDLIKFLREIEFLNLTSPIASVPLTGLVASLLQPLSNEFLASLSLNDVELLICALRTLVGLGTPQSLGISTKTHTNLCKLLVHLISSIQVHFNKPPFRLGTITWLVQFLTEEHPAAAFLIAFWWFRFNDSGEHILQLLSSDRSGVPMEYILSLDIGNSQLLRKFVVDYMRKYTLVRGFCAEEVQSSGKCEYHVQDTPCDKHGSTVRCGELRCREHAKVEAQTNPSSYLAPCNCGSGFIATEHVGSKYVCYHCSKLERKPKDEHIDAEEAEEESTPTHIGPSIRIPGLMDDMPELSDESSEEAPIRPRNYSHAKKIVSRRIPSTEPRVRQPRLSSHVPEPTPFSTTEQFVPLPPPTVIPVFAAYAPANPVTNPPSARAFVTRTARRPAQSETPSDESSTPYADL